MESWLLGLWALAPVGWHLQTPHLPLAHQTRSMWCCTVHRQGSSRFEPSFFRPLGNLEESGAICHSFTTQTQPWLAKPRVSICARSSWTFQRTSVVQPSRLHLRQPFAHRNKVYRRPSFRCAASRSRRPVVGVVLDWSFLLAEPSQEV